MSEPSDPIEQSPQRPAIDKADLDAVRKFLPGKLLGRTAAFLSLLLLALSCAGAVDAELKHFFGIDLQPAWLRGVVLFGLPLLIVACQLLVEWRADKNRRKTQALALQQQAVPTGYFRIGPYLAEDAPHFHRADQAHEKVLNWLSRAAMTPLYLTGDSGSAKAPC